MTDKPEETVTITIKEFQSLLQAQEWLSCLEDAGVDNWSGIDYAYELARELERGHGRA